MDSFLKGSTEDYSQKWNGIGEAVSHPSSNLSLDEGTAVRWFPTSTLLLVAATLAGASMNEPVILTVLVVGVICFGLPHGSLDPQVAKKLFGTDRRFTIVRFLATYAIVAALCAAGWMAAPGRGLCIFLFISALHFGSDWQQRGSLWGRIAYGACVVTVPTLRHGESVRQIYLALGATDAAAIVSVSRVAAGVVVAMAILSLFPTAQRRSRDCLELAIVLIGGALLPPLVFFVCYFCLLHSPRHLAETSREVGLRGLRLIGSAVAPTVAATIALAAVLWHFLPAARSSDSILRIVFVGLAALTVPHMVLTEMKFSPKNPVIIPRCNRSASVQRARNRQFTTAPDGVAIAPDFFCHSRVRERRRSLRTCRWV